MEGYGEVRTVGVCAAVGVSTSGPDEGVTAGAAMGLLLFVPLLNKNEKSQSSR